MKTITLTISDINRLKLIQANLSSSKSLTKTQRGYLATFLAQLPEIEALLIEKTSLDEIFEMKLFDRHAMEKDLENWIALFCNIPGYDYAPSHYIVTDDEMDLLKRGIIMTIMFAPSMSYNASGLLGFEIYLKADSTASFWIPTLHETEQYPELYNFKGSWKEAYLLLIETLKKGWPMEEFPEELKPLLKK